MDTSDRIGFDARKNHNDFSACATVVPDKFLHLPFVVSPSIDSGQACRTLR